MPTVTLTPIQDATLTDEFPTEKRGGQGQSSWGFNPFVKLPWIVVFNLATIPLGSIINSATLRRDVLLGTGGVNNASMTRRLLRLNTVELEMTWLEYASGLTWGTAGARGAADVTEQNKSAGVMEIGDGTGYHNISVSGMTQDGLPDRQVGFVTKHDTETGASAIESIGMREGSSNSQEELVIVYTLPAALTTTIRAKVFREAKVIFERLKKLEVGNPEVLEELERVDRNLDRLFSATGMVEWFAGGRETLPAGYIILDGRTAARVDNPVLFRRFGTRYGEGDGSKTFNMPNLIDRSIRGIKSAGSIESVGKKEFRHAAGSAGIELFVALPVTRTG